VEVKSKVRDESERPGFEAEEASSSPSHEPDSAAKGSDTEAEAEFEVEHVLARSLKQYYLDGDDDEDYDDGDDDYMYLVRWKGFGPEEDTWEPASGLGNADGALSDYSRHCESVWC
jgi:hypothetical protein